MKRLIFILMALFTLASMAACQAAPESTIVAPMELERVIAVATGTPQPSAPSELPPTSDIASPLYGKLGAPKTYQATIDTREESLSIIINAVVQLPDAEALPIVRVRPAQFSQEQVSALFEALCGDTPMYDSGRAGMSPAALDQNLLMWQGRVQEGGQSGKNAQAMVDYLKAEKAALPEDIEEMRSTAQLREMVYSFGKPDIGRYVGMSAVENPMDSYNAGKRFGVRNDPHVMDWDDENIDWGEEYGAYLSFINPAVKIDPPAENNYATIFSYIVDEASVPAEAINSLTRTPAQARAQADALLAETGSGLLSNAVYLEEFRLEAEDGQPAVPSTYAYVVTCGRVVGGVPCRMVTESDANNMKTLDSMAPSWFYERVEIEISDKGIARLSWQAPMEITETVTQSATLLPFRDIADIAARMLLVVYEGAFDSANILQQQIKADRMALELQRITEPNAVGEGILIPVWNIYGTITSEYSHGLDDGQSRWNLPRALLSINAIDGSIVDAWRGY